VLYLLKDLGEMTDDIRMRVAAEFENAVVEVLVTKTIVAARKHHVHTIIVGGGVAANSYLRESLTQAATTQDMRVVFPSKNLATDNAVMIGIAGCFGKKIKNPDTLRAIGNMTL
jgi:N6-L-threonylcarbamoyladenine synthase